MSLKKTLKEDIWHLINNVEIAEKSTEFFIFYMIRFLLNQEKIQMFEVVNIANKIKKEYTKIIEEIESEMINGNILDTINSSNDKCDMRIKPIMLKFMEGLQ